MLFGFFAENNNIVIDAEGEPHIDAGADNPDNKPLTLEDKSKGTKDNNAVKADEEGNKDGIENDTLQSKNAEVLK